jgi:hypothetical protein
VPLADSNPGRVRPRAQGGLPRSRQASRTWSGKLAGEARNRLQVHRAGAGFLDLEWETGWGGRKQTPGRWRGARRPLRGAERAAARSEDSPPARSRAPANNTRRPGSATSGLSPSLLPKHPGWSASPSVRRPSLSRCQGLRLYCSSRCPRHSAATSRRGRSRRCRPSRSTVSCLLPERSCLRASRSALRRLGSSAAARRSCRCSDRRRRSPRARRLARGPWLSNASAYSLTSATIAPKRSARYSRENR